EVTAGDPFDGGDGLGVGEVVRVEGVAELSPLAFEDEQQLVVAEWAVLVCEDSIAVAVSRSASSTMTSSSWDGG
ncbi:hypothetical protein, partial [Mycobacteroides abscessus]|uniref:hypothetical protein n=1 Tax=Mycobacteroides abscessus TaxID=36809 RepID=UPI0013F68C13